MKKYPKWCCYRCARSATCRSQCLAFTHGLFCDDPSPCDSMKHCWRPRRKKGAKPC